MLQFSLNWYACHQPERRPTADTQWHVGCEGCAIAYEAQRVAPPGGEFDGWHRRWRQEILDAIRNGDPGGLKEALADG